jgi:hypothetical protein
LKEEVMYRGLERFAACMLASLGAMSGEAPGQVYYESFDSYAPGGVPGGIWTDTSPRIDNPTVPSPNAIVIETIGANGFPTRAVQVVDAIGTSSGIIREVSPTTFQQLQMEVRIDQFSDANGAWPGGIGFLQDVGASDLNLGPQAVLYAWQDRRWHLFVKNAGVGSNEAIDILIPGLPAIEPGRWYVLYLDANTITGRFTAAVYDDATQQLINGVIFDFPNWDPAFGRFDAIAAFDGEPPTAVGTRGGVSTYDNVYYIPTPHPCPTDTDFNGETDLVDLLAVLADFGQLVPGATDVDNSGSVDLADLLAVLAEFGRPCP